MWRSHNCSYILKTKFAFVHKLAFGASILGELSKNVAIKMMGDFQDYCPFSCLICQSLLSQSNDVQQKQTQELGNLVTLTSTHFICLCIFS